MALIRTETLGIQQVVKIQQQIRQVNKIQAKIIPNKRRQKKKLARRTEWRQSRQEPNTGTVGVSETWWVGNQTQTPRTRQLHAARVGTPREEEKKKLRMHKPMCIFSRTEHVAGVDRPGRQGHVYRATSTSRSRVASSSTPTCSSLTSISIR